MTTIIKSCAESADDGWENPANGDTRIDNVTLWLGARVTTGYVAFRFAGFSGLSGATIVDVVIQFRAQASDTGGFVADWQAEKTASPAVFSAGSANYDISSRTLTTKTCEGDGSDYGNWVGGNDYDFPPAGYSSDNNEDFASLLQEVIDVPLNPTAIVFVQTYDSGSGERGAVAYDNGVDPPPELTVDYTAVAVGNPWYYYAQQEAAA